jgi:secreted Zn-dependent insulinase-like peptidase
MRKKLKGVSKEKFNKFLKIISGRLKRDRSMNRRTNRLWNEIVTERHYFNIKERVKDLVSKIKKLDLMDFFDRIFKDKLKKLSIQEFSSKIKKVPKKVGKVRGFKGKLIKNKNFFRLKNKFI